MSYQGYLTDQSGNPLGSTNTGPKNYNVIFRIWNTQTGGTAGGTNELYAEQQTVTVTGGYFSVLLGLGAQVGTEPHASQLSSLFSPALAAPLFVEITVLGIGTGGGNITILPRLQLISAPYAFLAANAVNAANLVNAGSTNVLSINNNSLSIPNAGSSLTVNGTVTATTVNATNVNAAAVSAATVSASSAMSAPTLTATTVNATTVNAPTINATNVSATATMSAPTVTAKTVTATTLNGYGTIPLGGIIMWSGATVPSGWALCDGTTINGYATPDLRGRFVLGSGSGSGLTTRVLNTIDGAENHLLTLNEIPAHNHNLLSTGGNVILVGTADIGTTKPDDGGSGGYGYEMPATTAVQSAGGGQAHNIMPPFYVLSYIMRVN